ncbi:hypothetical protein OUZ56_031958 [Daphnia magna]|uniref:Uncharacterized protein n=1 Tax=Daphnia magna TaxID=35525 RepID=A0ABQ9ZVQ3_9CRUS|nr:hypothetical protein OUZ56_031958 [Daphnia magna]
MSANVAAKRDQATKAFKDFPASTAGSASVCAYFEYATTPNGSLSLCIRISNASETNGRDGGLTLLACRAFPLVQFHLTCCCCSGCARSFVRLFPLKRRLATPTPTFSTINQ